MFSKVQLGNARRFFYRSRFLKTNFFTTVIGSSSSKYIPIGAIFEPHYVFVESPDLLLLWSSADIIIPKLRCADRQMANIA
jgi:hypothetical protein